MRCISHGECAAWCNERGYPVVMADYYGRPAPIVRKHFKPIELTYPVDSGEKVCLARDVMRSFGSIDLLLWVADWDVWPTSQHLPLLYRFRQAIGETRLLIEAPGHLITANELDDGISVLALALLFFWDCHVFPAVYGPVFVCSHDEWSSLFVPADHDPKPMAAALSAWLPNENVK